MEKEVPEKEYEELTVDFSKHTLKRIERANNEQEAAVGLILDHNEIQRLDNLETYPNLRKFSATNNQLVRMYGVSPLEHLVTLDLSSNSIVTIEGLKNLKQLRHINLAKNRIKNMEHFNNNLKLEKIDLSENNLTRISDISHLENLKSLNIHGNRISHLTQSEKKLPCSLEVLTLNNNSLADLNEISHLLNLTSLRELSIVNNPCLDFSENQKFNYRPFIKNWCTSLITLDNRPLDDIECLKAEWLYSQGRGRSFRPGEHAALIEYLISVCPKEREENAETEDVKKLKLILSKAQLHQQQLREQLSTGKFSSAEGFKYSVLKKKSSGIPERMITSFQESSLVSMSSKELRQSPELMTRSLDSGMMKKAPLKMSRADLNQTPLQTSTTFIPIPDSLISPDVSQPAVASPARPSSISSRTSRSSSRNSPYSTPESKRKSLIQTTVVLKPNENPSPIPGKRQEKLIYSRSSTPLEVNSPAKTQSLSSRNVASPNRKGIKSRESEKNFRETSEDEDSEILALKIKAVQQRVNQRKQTKSHQTDKSSDYSDKKSKIQKRKPFDLGLNATNNEEWKAAVSIQRWWRGYRTRNLNREVIRGCQSIQMNRMQDYIIKVVQDMEATKIALEGNKKLAVLQMQAINALWKKIATPQPAVCSNFEENKSGFQDLVQTCAVLNKKVEGLQAMIKTIQSSSDSLIPTSTQTDIIAVHTPQGEGREKFPYNPNLKPKSRENCSFPPPSEDDLKSPRDNPTDSESSPSSSKSGTLKAITELFMNSRLPDGSNGSLLGPLDEKDVPFCSETLTKPAVKLSESNCEKPPILPNETEKFGNEEFKNNFNS